MHINKVEYFGSLAVVGRGLGLELSSSGSKYTLCRHNSLQLKRNYHCSHACVLYMGHMRSYAWRLHNLHTSTGANNSLYCFLKHPNLYINFVHPEELPYQSDSITAIHRIWTPVGIDIVKVLQWPSWSFCPVHCHLTFNCHGIWPVACGNKSHLSILKVLRSYCVARLLHLWEQVEKQHNRLWNAICLLVHWSVLTS